MARRLLLGHLSLGALGEEREDLGSREDVLDLDIDAFESNDNVLSVLERYVRGELQIHIHVVVFGCDLDADAKELCTSLQYWGTGQSARVGDLASDGFKGDLGISGIGQQRSECLMLIGIRQTDEARETLPTLPSLVRLTQLNECPLFLGNSRQSLVDHPVATIQSR